LNRRRNSSPQPGGAGFTSFPAAFRNAESKPNFGSGARFAPFSEAPKIFRQLFSTQFWRVKMLNLAHETKKANEILKKIQNFQIIVRQEF
jgi:hypothetical protein